MRHVDGRREWQEEDLLVPKKCEDHQAVKPVWPKTKDLPRKKRNVTITDPSGTKTRPEHVFSFIHWCQPLRSRKETLILNEPLWSAVTCQFRPNFLLNVCYCGDLGSGSKTFIWFHVCKEIGSEGPCKVLCSPAFKTAKFLFLLQLFLSDCQLLERGMTLQSAALSFSHLNANEHVATSQRTAEVVWIFNISSHQKVTAPTVRLRDAFMFPH